jgi:hypothetical protein
VNLICPSCDDALGVSWAESEDVNYEYKLQGTCVDCYIDVIAYVPTQRYVKENDAIISEQVRNQCRF